MTVSIIVPAYNEETLIQDCLSRAVSQTAPAEEVIMIDNNCRDRTVEIARSIKGVTVVRETTQGMIPARNRGFDEASGDIIIRIDADTKMPEDWVARVRAIFAAHRPDAMSGPVTYYDAGFPTTGITKIYLKYLQSKLGHPCLIGSNMSLTKAIWQKVKNTVCLDDKLVHEDIDLSYHLGVAGATILYDPTMIMPTSARRIMKNPRSFFGEYPKRLKSTFAQHPAITSSAR